MKLVDLTAKRVIFSSYKLSSSSSVVIYLARRSKWEPREHARVLRRLSEHLELCMIDLMIGVCGGVQRMCPSPCDSESRDIFLITCS